MFFITSGLVIYFFSGLLFNYTIDMTMYFPYACIGHLYMIITPNNNITEKNKLQNILFTTRSLLCSGYFIYEKPIYYNYLTCIGSMVLNDIVCYFYKDIIYLTDEIFEHNEFMSDLIKYGMIENEYTAYAPVFIPQITNILTELVKKQKINMNQFNVYYHWLINSNIMVFLRTDYTFAPLSYCCAWYIYQMHKVNKENKYFCWIIIFILHSLFKEGIKNIKKIPDDFYYYPLAYVICFYVYQYISYINEWSTLLFKTESQQL